MDTALAASFTNFQDASLVIGQPDFTTQNISASQSQEFGQSSVALSSQGILAVGSQLNSRVLLWNAAPSANGANADVVVGQPDFTTTTTGTISAKMYSVNGVAFYDNGNIHMLIVSDSFNNRVTIWNTIPTANGQAANVVIGQTGFRGTTSGTSATKLNYPTGLLVTPDGKLLVADTSNNRVLIYNAIPTANNQAADVVIGQADMTSGTAGNQANQLSGPWNLAYANGKLLITDAGNNRVVVFNSIPTVNDASADVVIGQTNFGTSTLGTSSTTLNFPVGVAVSASGELAISDFGNNRVLIYDSIPTGNGAAANAVLGQPDFTSNTAFNGGVSSKSMKTPYAMLYDSNGQLYVPGRDMYRVMVFAPQPDITLSGNSQTIVNADATPAISDGTDFGTINVGATATHTFSISNPGAAALNLTGTAPDYVTLTGAGCAPFSVTQQASTPIAATGGSDFQITYTPVTAVLSSCTVSIASNVSGKNPYTFTIQGTRQLISQTISFTPPANQTYSPGGTFQASATASSGLTVSFSSKTTGVCTVNDLGNGSATVTIVTASTCSLAANQAGDGNYNAAPEVIGDVVIAKAAQTISFTPPQGQTYSPGGTFQTSATASSGLTVSFSSKTTGVCTVNDLGNGSGSATVTIVTAGTCTIAVNQTGDASYNAAPEAIGDVVVAKAAQTTSFTPPLGQTYSPGGTFQASATASSGLTVSFSSTTTGVCTVNDLGNGSATVTIVTAGTCTLAANQTGDANYNAAPETIGDVVVAKAAQTLSFTPPPSQSVVPEESLSLNGTASASSGLPVVFSSKTPDICTVADDIATLHALGICTIAVNQPGDGNYLAAPEVTGDVILVNLEHFLSYTSKGSAKFQPLNVPLKNSYTDASLSLSKPTSLALPAGVGGAEINVGEISLERYALKGKLPKFTKNVQITNELGSLSLTLGKPTTLLAPTAKSTTDANIAAPLWADHFVDNFLCYPANVTKKTPPFPKGMQAGLTDEFTGGERLFDVTKPTNLCLPVAVNNIIIKVPEYGLLCYAVKLTKNQAKIDKVPGVYVNNQLATGRLDALKPAEYCVPTMLGL